MWIRAKDENDSRTIVEYFKTDSVVKLVGIKGHPTKIIFSSGEGMFVEEDIDFVFKLLSEGETAPNLTAIYYEPGKK